MTIEATERRTRSQHIAAEIRAEMARQQISGRTLATKLGRSPNWVSLKTNGSSRLDFEDAEVIADALGIKLLELVRRAVAEPTRSYVPSAPGHVPHPDHPIVRTAARVPMGMAAEIIANRRERRTAPTGR